MPQNALNNELNGTVFEVNKIKNATLKNESFADDSSTFTKFTFEVLRNLKQILEDFRKISSLKCNFEKTAILRIGKINDDIDPRILDLGYDITDSVVLLGFQIDKNGIREDAMLKKIEKKIRLGFGKASISPYQVELR